MPKGNIRFVKLKSIDDFEVVSGKKVVNTFPVHIHEKYCIGIIESGCAVLVLEKREIKISSGDIYFINPNEPHQLKPFDKEGFNHIVLNFGMNFINNYFSNRETSKTGLDFNHAVIHNKDIWNSIIKFDSMIKNEDTAFDVEFEVIRIFVEMYEYFSFLSFDDLKSSEKTYSITKVCEYIRDNLKESLSLQEMSSIAGLSKFHFLRTFKREIGISPYEFQIQLKIKLSKKMLLDAECASYVSAELGFSDQSHFIRFFKRNTGVTPAQFVKMNIKR